MRSVCDQIAKFKKDCQYFWLYSNTWKWKSGKKQERPGNAYHMNDGHIQIMY